MRAFILFIGLAIAQFCAASDTIRDGSSPATAIVMHGSSRTFEDEAFRIILQRYPDAKRDSLFYAVGFDGRTYLTTLTFSTKHGRRMMYFDTTRVH